ncbi:AmmeMemoRadiSam system protein B [Endozoicomonas sp. (ex Bugula neritina AB1)]|nr:AmmeMemoRadiSam system protein B [Endozoicomonas sp. (ex Bugula neritina AB1)]
MTIRQPAVAGMFYPDSASALNSFITDMLDDSPARDLSPKVLVVPHAGYIYSGSIAASAYRLLEGMKNTIRRVVLLGPAHRAPLEGMAVPDCDAFSTPLGDIPLDTQAMNNLLQLRQVHKSDIPHNMEHSLEVQCPFLQMSLNDFQLIPIVVGDATPLAVAEVLDSLWGDEETLIIISTDLSHFHNYEEATYRDNLTVKAIEQLSSNLTGGQACGCHPLNGMMKVAQRRGMEVITLDVRNSGDTAGDKNRVVGYGSFVIQ